MKIFAVHDILSQCAICGEETEHILAAEKWHVGDESHAAICPRCSEDDDTAIVTYIAPDIVLDDSEAIREFLDETSANTEQVDNLLRDRLPDKIESYTAWVMPLSRYPKRDWVTVREAAKIIGLPRETLATWIKRGKLFDAQIKGLIQNAGGSVLLLHRSVVEEIRQKIGRGLT